MMNLSAEDIAFIQSSYRDAKRKPSQRDTLKDLYPDVTPAEFAELTGTLVSDWVKGTPDQVSGLQILFERLTDPVSEYLIKDIARRVQEAGQMTSTAAYQAYKLQTLGKTMSEIQEQIALLLSVSADQAAEIIQAAAEYGYNLDADRLGSSVSFADNVHAQQVTDAAVKLARRDLTNI